MTSESGVWLFVCAFGTLVAVVGAGTLWISRTLAPLRRVAETAEAIVASGDVSRRVDAGAGSGEALRIAGAFNAVVTAVEALLSAQERLLADTSHELRNPLTVVRTNVELLGKPLDEGTRREVARETEREIERMVALIGDLTLLSRAEHTRPARMEPVRLNRLAGEAVERLRPLAAGRSLTLTTAGTGPVVVGDENRLLQVAINLIGNAIRYTPADGHIGVFVERSDQAGVLRVQDDGIGIASEHLPHLFDRFYRVDSARARATGGTGLGLAIVKAIVEAHQGRVEVQSTLGEGSVFTVFLPLEGADTPRITNLMPVVRA